MNKLASIIILNFSLIALGVCVIILLKELGIL